MADFKTFPLRPMTGVFDTLSSNDEILYGNFKVVKNAVTRSPRNRQRSGGWRRAFAEAAVFNNQDLHDQLLDRLAFRDSYAGHSMGGGGVTGYAYPYHVPYSPIPADVDITFLRSHWRMNEITLGVTPDLISGHDLTSTGATVVPGRLDNAIEVLTGNHLEVVTNDLDGGDILFGMTGWVQRVGGTSALEYIAGKWGAVFVFQLSMYKVEIENHRLKFTVSSNGFDSVSLTGSRVLGPNEWFFFAAWHDPVANTINLMVNNETPESLAHAGGVAPGGITEFSVGRDRTLTGTMNSKIDSLSLWKNGFPTTRELLTLYHSGLGTDYAFEYPPDHGGFPYGDRVPILSSQLAYDFTYCGDYLRYRSGCNEAITMLNEIVTAASRKLIAATMSRTYELNQSAGNWRLLADGLGNAGYTVDQCGCNAVRNVSATMGGYYLQTNNFDPPMIYFAGDDAIGCELQALQVITDLEALGITKAGGVVTWKGFTFFYDITENSERFGGDIIWSDLENPNAYIESDVSLAGRVTLAVGETILWAAPLGNWLVFLTDKSIWRTSLVGGDAIFNFERIYRGGDAMKYKFSGFNTGDMLGYLGESDIYFLTQFDTRPLMIPWVTKAAGMIFLGIHEDDADYEPINKEACDLVTGGWSEEKHEAWLSWCSGSNTCPDVTLRLNLKFNAADFVDHGFTAYLTFRPDDRPTVGQWLEDLGVCPRGSKVAVGIKDGAVCTGAVTEVENPPLYIRNPEEDASLPVHEDSLCARLMGKTIEDFCQSCAAPTKFLMASAQDFTIKQQEDSIYFRERLGFGKNPCRDFDFPTEAGTAGGIVGTPIVLDEWMELGEVNCEVSEVKMLAKFSPCAAAGGLGFTELIDSGLSIGWQSTWQGIAFCDSLDRVIADSTDGTGIALINFNAGPALDYVLPLNTPFETRGIFYHPKADVIIVWVRYGTFPGYTYRLAFMDPVDGLSSEIDLGVPGGTNEYEAVFTTIGFSTIGILIRSLTLGNPHLIAVVDVDTRTVVVSKFFEADGGTRPTYDFFGLQYSCQLGELCTIGNKIDTDGVFFQDYIIRFDLATLAITQEFLIAGPDALDYRNPQYITATGRLIAWDVSGYADLDPATGAVVHFDNTFTGNVVPIYFWKLDRFVTIDEANGLLLLINPNDYTKQTIPFAASAGDAYNFAVARAQGKLYTHEGLFSPFAIREFRVI